MNDSLQYRTLWRRSLAAWGDGMIFWTIALFWGAPANLIGSRAWHAVGMIILEFAFFGYRILAHAFAGQTVGKRLAGVRVVSITGGDLTLRQALAREGLLLSLGAIPVLQILGHALFGAQLPRLVVLLMNLMSVLALLALSVDPLLAAVHPRRRALHDFIAGTIVVRCDKLRSAA